MSALVDGFETARKENEARLAEHRRLEEKTDAALAALAKLIGEDGAFLDGHAITVSVVNRILHVNHQRSPVVAVHFDPGADTFRMVSMRDNATTTHDNADACARAIGSLLFGIIR